jgi:hypothetical protein
MPINPEASQRTLAEREANVEKIAHLERDNAELRRTVLGLSKVVAEAALAGFVIAKPAVTSSNGSAA